MQEDIKEILDDVSTVEKEVINLMVSGVFCEEEDMNQQYLHTIQQMTKHFVECVDDCASKSLSDEKRTSIVSVAVSFLQTSMNIICRNADDSVKEKLIMMAFPDYEVTLTKRHVQEKAENDHIECDMSKLPENVCMTETA